MNGQQIINNARIDSAFHAHQDSLDVIASERKTRRDWHNNHFIRFVTRRRAVRVTLLHESITNGRVIFRVDVFEQDSAGNYQHKRAYPLTEIAQAFDKMGNPESGKTRLFFVSRDSETGAIKRQNKPDTQALEIVTGILTKANEIALRNMDDNGNFSNDECPEIARSGDSAEFAGMESTLALKWVKPASENTASE